MDIRLLIIGPVIYQAGYFWDAKNHMIADMRGWGWLQYQDDAEAKQDAMGEFIAEAINEKLKMLDLAAGKAAEMGMQQELANE